MYPFAFCVKIAFVSNIRNLKMKFNYENSIVQTLGNRLMKGQQNSQNDLSNHVPSNFYNMKFQSYCLIEPQEQPIQSVIHELHVNR